MDRHALYNQMVGRLLDHVEGGTADYAADTLRVPAASYADPQVWQREMDGIFKSLPILVALSMKYPSQVISRPWICWERPC